MQRRTHPRRLSVCNVRGRWQWLAPLSFLTQALCCPAFAQDLDDETTSGDEAAGGARSEDADAEPENAADREDTNDLDEDLDEDPANGDATEDGDAASEGANEDGNGAAPEPPTAPARDPEEDGVDPATTAGPLPPGRAIDSAGNPLVAAHFESPREGLRIFLGPARAQPDRYGTTMGRPRLDTGELRELCAAPCARWIYPGEYSFGAAPARKPDERDEQPLRARDPLLVDTPVLVTTNYQSYAWLRTVGWITMGAGLVGGSSLVLVAFDRCAGDGLCLQNSPYAWLGAGTFFLGVTGGLLLTLKGDEVSFSLTPNPGLPEPR